MNRKIITFSLLMLACGMAGAQTFERAIRNNFWNDGQNAAGLRCDGVSLSNAELGGTYEAGRFRSPSDPVSQWTAGALARTVTHLKNFSMAGSFGFSQNEQYDVCGSMFMNPGVLPYDAIETTPGRKTLQTYDMQGMISVDLSSRLRVGGRLDFKSSNAAKKKDLRYSDYLLDLSFVPSVQYLGDGWIAGASLLYGRYSEILSAEQIGSATSAPSVFFDEGVSAGFYQEWTGSNVHLKEAGATGHPVRMDALGLGLQFSMGPWYADAEFDYRFGKSGEKQLIWYEFSGPELKLHGAARFGAHAVRVDLGYDFMSNSRNILDKKTVGGVTTTVCYGSNRILETSDLSGAAEYEWMADALEVRGRADIGLGRTLATPMYPSYLTRQIGKYALSADALYHTRHFDFGAGLCFMTGSMTDETGSVETFQNANSSVTKYVDCGTIMKKFYYLAKESVEAPRIPVNLSVRYKFYKGMYAEADAGLVKAFGLECIDGGMRWAAGLKLGYNF